MSSDDLLAELLSKPVGPQHKTRQTEPDKDLTRQVEVTGDVAAVTIRGPVEEVDEDAATAYLREQGLNPSEWVATGFRSSEWTLLTGGTGISTRFTYRRASAAPTESERYPIDELIAGIKDYRPVIRPMDGEYGFIVALGDMQFGKLDGDGPAGTVSRTIDYIDRAADLLMAWSTWYDIGHVHIAWLGDHVEGFNSQGGANVWRTGLTLTEQIRLTRRVMLHALTTFSRSAKRVSMAAVPGNHGETVRFAGKGITRYDDSHDTESLVAVADAASLNQEAFGHVEFYVPSTDEMTVVLDVAGTVVAHAHGHQWRTGKALEWWRGQAFNAASPMHQANVLLAGHLHHFNVDTDGSRTFIQVPAMESESTWFRHATGTTGAPGLVVALVKGGAVKSLEIVR